MRSRTTIVALSIGAVCVAVGGVLAGVAAARTPAAGPAAATPHAAPPAQPASETSFVPITPCRILDTRSGTGVGATPLGNQQTRTYYVGGTAGFAAQGGAGGGCGIPVGAVAIAASFKAVNPAKLGFVRAWPAGQSEPTATAFTYSGTGGSGATVAIADATAQSLTLRNYGGPTDLTVDVFGYYLKPIEGFITPSGALYSGTSRLVDAVQLDAGSYKVTIDRNVKYCSATASVFTSKGYAATDTSTYASSDAVLVHLFDGTGAPVNQYFYLTITC